MRIIEPSISEREAEKMYPTQYWEGTKTKRSFDMTTGRPAGRLHARTRSRTMQGTG